MRLAETRTSLKRILDFIYSLIGPRGQPKGQMNLTLELGLPVYNLNCSLSGLQAYGNEAVIGGEKVWCIMGNRSLGNKDAVGFCCQAGCCVLDEWMYVRCRMCVLISFLLENSIR